jgi:uncharacterized membrane protein YdjX (TVP38/TMEM64 family)
MIDSVKQYSYRLPKKDIVKIVVFIVLFGIFVAGVSAIITRYFGPAHNPTIEHFITQNPWAFLVYFLYVTIASIIIPIPTLPADVIFLKLANPLAVISLRLLADIAGSSIDFYLAKRYGRPLLRRWFSDKNYQFIEEAAENISWQQFFIVAMIPIINTELLAYAGGISKLKFRNIIWALTLAILYRLLFVYFILKI